MPQSSAELAKKYGGTPTTADLAAQFGGKRAESQPQAATPATPDAPKADVFSQIKDALVGLWEKQPIHPIDMVTGTAQALAHPIDTAKGVVQAQGVPLTRAQEALQRGDYVGAATHFVDYLIPIIGPQISEAQERQRTGEISTGRYIGESAGIATQVALPEAAKRLPNARIGAIKPNPNAAERAAVDFAEREGIPVDAATATGSRVVKGTQALADRSLGGSFVSERAQKAQEAALTRTSGTLADRAHPTAVSPYQAGEAVQQGVQTSLNRYADEANTAYDTLRTIEADPKNTATVKIRVKMTDADGKVTMETRAVPMQMPVNLKAAKAQLRPLYERMMRQMPVAQQRADPALHAIKNILDAPDYLPASMVDADLSAIKALARTDGPTRNVSQGFAANAVRALEDGVQAAVQKAGPDAVDALKKGRAATVKKYGAADLLQQLRDEPVQVFDQATWANDAGIDRLRALQKESPAAMAKLGRAWLDKLFEGATSEGGFKGAAGLQAKWEKLGPETKKLLFKNPTLIKDLDNFFLLAKRMADNPNPSGSGYVGALAGQGVYTVLNPATGVPLTIAGAALSKLLHSPAGVRVLTKGLSVPLASKGQALSTWAALQAAAKAEGVRLTPAPAFAEQEQSAGAAR